MKLITTLSPASAAALALVVLGLAGCDKEEPPPPKAQEVILNVRTLDLAEKPVQMVRFYINGKKFGITDQDGAFRGRYPAKDGDVLTFNVEPPPGYSVPPNIDQSRWQVTVKYPADGRPLQVDFTAPLQRPERDYLFMVRTGTPATPVRVNDKIVGKTSETGEALLRVSGVPGTRFSARAGDVVLSNATFAEDDEIYLLTAVKQGALGGAGAEPGEVVAQNDPPEEAPAVEPPEPDPPAEPPPPPVQREPDPPPPVVAARTPSPRAEPDDPWEAPAPARRVERVERAERVAPPPEEVRWEPPPREPDPPPRAAEPEPVRPQVVEITGDGDGELLLDDPAPPARDDSVAELLDDPSPAPVAAIAPAPSPARTAAPSAGLDDGILDDDGATVDRGAIDQKATIAAGAGASPVTMSREEISTRLDEVQARLKRSQVLQKADVDFLAQIDRSHPGYYEANRLLADFYYRLPDYRRQAESLEEATKRGRYKHDPAILLSLAKAYAQQKRYRKALSAMGRVEAKMRRLPADQKADAFRFHAEMLEFEFLRQYHDDPKRANITLVDKAVSKWERYRTFAAGADPGAMATADKRIAKLNELKSGLEL